MIKKAQQSGDYKNGSPKYRKPQIKEADIMVQYMRLKDAWHLERTSEMYIQQPLLEDI